MPAQSRRFAEIYEWEEKQEARGRGIMNTATPYGIVTGAIVVVLVYLVFAARGDASTGGTAGFMVGAVVGYWLRQRRYEAGSKVVLDAQRTLVAVATEQNTREIVHILKSHPIHEE